jgi:hypothetical protein
VPSKCQQRAFLVKVPAQKASNVGGIQAARPGYRGFAVLNECLDECPFPTLAYAYEISTR